MKHKDTKNSRRAFLKKSVSGLAGIAILPSVMQRDVMAQEEQKLKKRKIITRTLGRTGLELPIVSLGVGNVQNPELVKAALDAGVKMLDTANSYGRGRNEEMIGEIIKGRPRDSFVIATKVTGAEDRRTGLFRKEATSEMFREKFETSLGRLGLDYVDILYIHSVVRKESVVYEPFLSAMLKLKKEGKVRFLGVSTHANEPEVIRAAAESKVHDVVLTAYNFRQPHVAEVEKAMAEAAKAGLGIVAMKTQAGVFWDPERQNQINMKAALKWALRKEYVHTSIPTMATFDQLEEDMSVMEELELTPVDKKDLQLGARLGVPGLYCRQCGECKTQCREDLDIPILMRSYMYVYGYRNLASAKEALASVDLPTAPCNGCGTCAVTCSMGFDVRAKIEDIARLQLVPDEFVV
ncbi:MAG: aldo/keto reductase [bacterium]|nr:MAG: aldo/keto reductase [bacterium]